MGVSVKHYLKQLLSQNQERGQKATVLKKRGLMNGQQFLCSACALD
jgi:hypothetical protein